MADEAEREELQQWWHEVMGDCDSESDDFEGFTLREIVKGEESDIDLDSVVRDEQLLEHFAADGGSDNYSESGG